MADETQAVIEQRVLAACSLKAQHSSLLKHAKPIVDRLVARGLLRRFKVPPATVPLWLEITPQGVDRLAELRGEAS